MSAVKKCLRCKRRLRERMTGWNIQAVMGRIVGYVCPACQTPEENAEAEINLATLDYTRGFTMPSGRIVIPSIADRPEAGDRS